MSWWTVVPGLTPMAVWDAARVSADQILDGVGSNNLTTSTPLSVVESSWKALQGNNGAAFNMAATISLPATGVVLLFIKAAQRYVGLSFEAASTNYLLCHWGNNDWYFNNSHSYNSLGVSDTNWGAEEVITLVKGASTSQIYRNAVQIGGPVPNAWVPTYLDRLGQSGYWLDLADRFMAAGVWSGTATQAELVALEAAVRSALESRVTTTCRGLRSATGRLNTASIEALTPTGVVNRYQAQRLGVRNLYFGGAGLIAGTVKITPNQPTHRKVRLFHEATGILIAETWSDATTGAYSFTHIDPTQTYTVIGFDYTQAYRAVIADRVTPELMP